MKIKIKDILPNPFRNIEHYPILRPKINTLKRSYQSTEFWDNIVGRINSKGQFEQAYGHHRKVALLEQYGPNHEVKVIVKDLDDGHMIKIMANENMDEWGTSAIVEIETVEAVVKAFAEGRIKLRKPLGDQYTRCAPSFIPKEKCNTTTLLYNAQTVAEFLGWTVGEEKAANVKVKNALTALQYIEEGIIELSEFDELTSSGINAVIQEARQAREYKESRAKEAQRDAEAARREAEAAKKAEEHARAHHKEEKAREKAAEHEEALRKEARQKAEAQHWHKEGQKAAGKVGKAVSAHLRSGGGVKTAGDVAITAVPIYERKPPPDIVDYLKKALTPIWQFCMEDSHAEKLNRVLEFKDDLDRSVLINAARTLRDVRDRMEYWAKEFDPGRKRSKPRKVPSPPFLLKS
jgi:ParB-like nuclease family protein